MAVLKNHKHQHPYEMLPLQIAVRNKQVSWLSLQALPSAHNWTPNMLQDSKYFNYE